MELVYLVIFIAVAVSLTWVAAKFDNNFLRIYFRVVGTAKRLRAYARDPRNPLGARLAAQAGAVNIESIILIFIAIIIIYKLIPNLSSSNAEVQASENASAMAKFSAGLGEWMFPLLGIVAVVFLLFRHRRGSSAG